MAPQRPTDGLRREHREGRELVDRMAAALARLRAGDNDARPLLAAAEAYVQLIRGHIAKEDHGLFEAADTLIDADACRRLCDAYDAHCARRHEGRSLRDLERLAERLRERYPGA